MELLFSHTGGRYRRFAGRLWHSESVREVSLLRMISLPRTRFTTLQFGGLMPSPGCMYALLSAIRQRVPMLTRSLEPSLAQSLQKLTSLTSLIFKTFLLFLWDSYIYSLALLQC